MNERVNNFENICIKCGKLISEHPTTGRFNASFEWLKVAEVNLLNFHLVNEKVALRHKYLING